MVKLRLPFQARLALASSATGWAAAVYGALYIYAAGDFRASGSLWIFGWPFGAMLLAATAAHFLLAGGGARFGIPSPSRAVTCTNRVIAATPRLEDTSEKDLATALAALPWAPVMHAAWCMSLAGLVVVTIAALERSATGTMRNVGPILTGGTITTLLYGGSAFTICELLVSKPCWDLRLAGVERGLDPYRGPTVDTWVRVTMLASPTVFALAVALRLTAAPELPHAWVAQATLMILSAGICGALAWLLALAMRNAAADLGVAANRLARGEIAYLITGTVDAQLVGMARAFNVAAGEIDRSRQISAARYAALFEGAGDAILLVDATSGRILEANRRAQELTRLGEPALKATRFVALFAADAGVIDLWGLDLAAGRWPAGTSVVRPDGSRCPVDVALSAVPLGDCTVIQAIVHDVSERERTERELRRAVQRLEGLYHLAVTLGGTVEQVADHVAVTLAQLLDAPLVGVERLEGDETVILAMYENGRVTHEGRLPLAGTPCERVREEKRSRTYTDAARRFPANAFLVERGIMTYSGLPVIVQSGEVLAIVWVLDTRVRQLREEDMRLLSTFAQRLARAFDEEEYAREREAFVCQLTAQNVELSAAQERLTEAHRLKSEFMGMMSHELRTPLNVFIGYTELLLDASREAEKMPPQVQRDVLERMLDAARTLARLVEDTLSVLRLESVGVAVNVEPVSVASLFAEIQATERFLHPPSGVVERWEVEDGLPAIVSDRLKLRQVLTNLLGNARKFTRAGTITVRAASVGTASLAFTVEDTGCGIAPADLPFIFDLYRQAANGGAHNGCGIGLYIVRRYCELLGGRVEVVSDLGRGTRFMVTLPQRPGGAEWLLPDGTARSAPAAVEQALPDDGPHGASDRSVA